MESIHRRAVRMTVRSIQAHDILANVGLRIAFHSAPLGEGAQGLVHEITAVDGALSHGYLLKRYFDAGSDQRNRLSHALNVLIDRLTSRSADALPWLDALEALPIRLLQLETGEIAIAMKRAGGWELDDPAGRTYRALRDAGLAARLEIARQIADGVARLHRIGVVPADISGPNIMVDVGAHRAWLIDIDGGGVLDHDGDFLTEPLVLGQETWRAPEIYVHQLRSSPVVPAGVAAYLRSHPVQQLPNEYSDRWSLAMAIHKTLLYGLAPFWSPWARSYTTACDPDAAWPPDAEAQRRLPKHCRQYSDALEPLGRVILSHFRTAFRGDTRLEHPSFRPAASEWANALARAVRWVHVCANGHEFVAWSAYSCGTCGDRVRHAKIRDAMGARELVTDENVTAVMLGLPSSLGLLARIERRGEKLFVAAERRLTVNGRPIEGGGEVGLGYGRNRVEVSEGSFAGLLEIETSL